MDTLGFAKGRFKVCWRAEGVTVDGACDTDVGLDRPGEYG